MWDSSLCRIRLCGQLGIKIPEQGGLHIIVKANGQAGYFSTHTADTQVYPGVWTADNTGIELLWEDESRHILTQHDKGTKISHFSASGQELYAVYGTKMKDDILGTWYQAPRSTQQSKDPNRLYESLQGNWTMKDHHILSILKNRLALLYSEQGELKQSGRWTRKEKSLEIIWNSGDYARLKLKGSNYTYGSIPANLPIDEAALPEQLITRNYSHPTKDLPVNTKPTSLSFSSRKEQVKYFQGIWIFERAEKEFERISIGRFGGARSDRKYQLNGKWLAHEDGLNLSWDDGMRGQLLYIVDAFVYLEYAAGRPLDGIPNRILKVAPSQLDRLGDENQVAHKDAAYLLETAKQYPNKPKRPHKLSIKPLVVAIMDGLC